MKSYVPLAFGAGAVLGALGALAASSWRPQQRESAYCVDCAMHRDVVGGVERLRAGVVHTLLADGAATHVHRWAGDGHLRDPDARTLLREAAHNETDDLDALERDPAALSTLTEAVREDPERARRFVRLLIDPGASVDRAAVGLLSRPDAPWTDRWRVVDGFVSSYRCVRLPASVTCSLPVGSFSIVAWHQVPRSLLRGPVPWATWTPPGFVPTPRMAPIPPPSVGLSPQGPGLIPIPSPTPDEPPATEPAPDIVPAPIAPSQPDAPRAVERAITLAQQGQLEAAAREHARLQRESPQTPGLARLREVIRSRAVSRIDEVILSGRCADAQRLYRTLRGAGLSVDAREHFGSACPLP